MLCDLITQGTYKDMKNILHLASYTEICKRFLTASMLYHNTSERSHTVCSFSQCQHMKRLLLSGWRSSSKEVEKNQCFLVQCRYSSFKCPFEQSYFFSWRNLKDIGKHLFLQRCHGWSASVLLCKSRSATWSSFQTVLRHYCRHSEKHSESRYSILIVSIWEV